MPRYFIQREGSEAGPYDVVQMAGLLRRKIIDDQTLTRGESDDAWKPFSWQPHFSIAREMPADAASERTVELDHAAAERAAGRIPMPSPETWLKLGSLALAVLLTFGGSYLLAKTSETIGYGLVSFGAGIVIIAQVCILARLVSEDAGKIGLISFIPGYDVYYFTIHFWTYFRWFCLKYVGAAIGAGAALGLGEHL